MKKKVNLKLKNRNKKETSIPIKIPTGIPGYDSLVDGGYEANSINLLVGGSGNGKSIFAIQFLLGGMDKGETCLYITFEEKRKAFFSNMLELGIDLEEYEKKGLFIFIEYTPEKVETMLEEGGGSIESTIHEKKVSRLVIDSITSFALLFESEMEKREAALSLFNLINTWNCTTLLTFEEELSSSESKTSKAIQFESDSITAMYYVFEGQERQRFLEVLKMRGSSHSHFLHKFEITKKGIKVDPNPLKKALPTLKNDV